MNVAIIIPFFNASKYIKKTIESIQFQTDVEKEVIIVNDGSSDSESKKLLDIVSEFVGVKVLEKKNGGLSSARNFGKKHTNAEYLIFLDADDLLGYGQIKTQLDLIRREDCDICISKYSISNENLSGIKNQPSYQGEGLSRKYLALQWERGLSIPIHSVLFKRKILDDMEFDAELKSKEDYDFWLRLFEKPIKVSFCDEYMPIYRVTKNSMTRSRLSSMNEIHKLLKKNIDERRDTQYLSDLAANIRGNYGLWNSF